MLDTLAMPFVLIAMGLSALGCLSWFLLMIVFVTMGGFVKNGTFGLAMAVWTVAAAMLGFWNFGRFMAYFGDAERKMIGVAKALGVSGALVATNPLLWYAAFA
ncbi:hypothetical protein [Novosphingobium soli]|uniref:Uncharacterized protein n=1 Tax=Novosphingobium soli TaxID=574956 RepID=A0ABV6CYL3_9SPHN